MGRKRHKWVYRLLLSTDRRCKRCGLMEKGGPWGPERGWVTLYKGPWEDDSQWRESRGGVPVCEPDGGDG